MNMAGKMCHASMASMKTRMVKTTATARLTSWKPPMRNFLEKRSARLPATIPSKSMGANRLTPTRVTISGDSVFSRTNHDAVVISIIR